MRRRRSRARSAGLRGRRRQSLRERGRLLEVRDVDPGGVVLDSRGVGPVELPDIFEARCRAQQLHHVDRRALGRPVLHDCGTRPQPQHHRRRIGDTRTVVRDHEEVDRTDEIVRAHQLHLFVPEQVAEVGGAKPPEGDDAANRLAVFRIVGDVFRLCRGARRVGPARTGRAGERRLQHVASGRHNSPVESLDRHRVARLDDEVFGFGPQLRVRRLESWHLLPEIRHDRTLDGRTVIDEGADRNILDELLKAADVIDVVMGRDQVIDALHASRGEHFFQAIKVPRSGTAAVDQHRFAGGRDPQRGLSAFGIDNVDLQRALGADTRGGDQHEQKKDEPFHTFFPAP